MEFPGEGTAGAKALQWDETGVFEEREGQRGQSVLNKGRVIGVRPGREPEARSAGSLQTTVQGLGFVLSIIGSHFLKNHSISCMESGLLVSMRGSGKCRSYGKIPGERLGWT